MLEILLQARALLEQEIAAAGPHLVLEPRGPGSHARTPIGDERPMPDLPMERTTTSDRTPPSPNGSHDSDKDPFTALIPAESPIRAILTLEALAEYVAQNELVDIDRTRTNPVFGVGNPSADLMVIGEAPGADEDLKGEPFVGRAGQLLDKILEATGFSRQTVYIANILKSRPPNNRDPLPDEIAAHAPILYRQISLIRPKIILSVGRVSACALMGRTASLASMRGKLHDFHGIPLVVTYHPAALLRNPQWKRPTWEDMKFLRMQFDRLLNAA